MIPNPIARRRFLKSTLGAGLAGVPGILPVSLFGAASPNQRVQVAQIGCGRMGREDMNGVLNQPQARVVAVCDLDSRRAKLAAEAVEKFYSKKGASTSAVKIHSDYREILADPAIDAVVVSTPDHWHGLLAIEAALAGKHLYVQKPLTYDIAESIALEKVVRAKKVILQTGSQQRSSSPFGAFRPASEAVRNGRIGKVKTLKIGIGIDKPSGKKPAAMPVPSNLDFKTWLGPAPEQEYMEGRVHPQNSVDGRPGWITTEDFGLGMITNWGAHHIDIAQWALGQELGGPSDIVAKADFMKDDVWTVHQTYHVEMTYPGGVTVILDNSFENGIHFEGEEGWIFCARGNAAVTASDPNKPSGGKSALRASDAKLLAPLTASEDKRWPQSRNHYANWIESILANRDPIAPVDQAARSLQTCAAAWIGMKLGRKVTWDTASQSFKGDADANAMCGRKPRAGFDFAGVMSKAGV